MAQDFGTIVFAERAGAARDRMFLWTTLSGGMPMPGGWTMSMAWMRMPGQTWLGAATSFMGMWVLMMMAMMLPSLVPMLSRYRRAVRRSDETRLGVLTALVGAGYFSVWTALGAGAYPLGILVGAAEMRWQVLACYAPLATGVVLLFAGGVQLSEWKAHQLDCCRGAPDCEQLLPPNGARCLAARPAPRCPLRPLLL